jgi:hypothetical protein
MGSLGFLFWCIKLWESPHYSVLSLQSELNLHFHHTCFDSCTATNNNYPRRTRVTQSSAANIFVILTPTSSLDTIAGEVSFPFEEFKQSHIAKTLAAPSLRHIEPRWNQAIQLAGRVIDRECIFSYCRCYKRSSITRLYACRSQICIMNSFRIQ